MSSGGRRHKGHGWHNCGMIPWRPSNYILHVRDAMIECVCTILAHIVGQLRMNLPHFLLRSLMKMSSRFRAWPNTSPHYMFHTGLIRLLIEDHLRKQNQWWAHFLLWGEFNEEVATKPKSKKGKIKPKKPKTRPDKNIVVGIPDDTSKPSMQTNTVLDRNMRRCSLKEKEETLKPINVIKKVNTKNTSKKLGKNK